MSAPREVAHAILLVDGAYALQLRDDLPGIAYPGLWSFFGGGLEPRETPEEGLRREIVEELGISPVACDLFWQGDRVSAFWGTTLRHWVFVADVTALWPSHVVLEGAAAGIFPFRELPQAMVPLAREMLERHHRRSAAR